MLIVFPIETINAQCYDIISDLTGIDYSEYLVNLNDASCGLNESFPQEYQNSFKVLSSGQYPISSDFKQFDYRRLIRSKASEVSEYSLLFTKTSTLESIYDNIYVDINLPGDGVFSCVDSIFLSEIEALVQFSVNQEYSFHNRSYNSFWLAEIKGINVLKSIINNVVSGSCCLPPLESIDEWLESKDFYNLEVYGDIINVETLTRIDESSTKSLQNIVDFTGYEIEIDGRAIDLSSTLSDLFLDESYSYSDPKGFIITAENICGDNFNVIENEIGLHLPNVSVIIFLKPVDENRVELWMRHEGMDVRSIPVVSAAMENYTPPSGGVTSFSGLVDIIRNSEDSLIANSYGSIDNRIEILRGMYYGTPWSMDYNQSYGSSLRNNGFKVYLCDPTDPINPDTILSPTLYSKLKSSPEVVDGSRGTDWGHIIIGLEARSSFCSRSVNVVLHESTGLEITTWIGDVGGGAGMLSFKRITNPNEKALGMFVNSPHDFGGWINLEGDIAAYLVGRDTTKNFSVSPISISDTSYISDAVSDYLLDQNGFEWKMRGKIFLQILGGDFVNDTLTNESQLVNHLSEDIADFAEKYLLNMATGRNVNLYEASKHINGVSIEMAELFINSLKQIVINPARKATPRNFNPTPTPPGKPFMKYKLMKSGEIIFKKIEDYFKNY